ncbi:beta-glucanase (GH16 family) [Dysgonomonas hofstadii]|uniref:Beta-glucanase (GH16 family) n=1 Tax=Dysgonomonas hofstadii TaxID=637886 RepID=A0A840CK08_9BACT|nr:glycoside hydrolase family 16 protein [Dysgonomonas hofstadii]MBB4034358.1 beta-glucanase (GH16 family) [Dysgonomonas hofstadii]
MKLIYFFLLFLATSIHSAYAQNETYAKPSGFVPEGYALVWQDEFNNNQKTLPYKEWWFETGNHGWGNHELQNYVDRVSGNDTVAKIQNGSLIITAYKLAIPYQGSDIISARMNTKKSWKYGYFEMRAKVPAGKGTWAAFWMLPENFQHWPLDGEIDIMEYVGYKPGITHATIHTKAYNHAIKTEKSAEHHIKDIENEFHTYSVEWTEDYIKGYVDGIHYFTFQNDKKGDMETWPFDKPFYLKLNLAIGGDWGGREGVDPAIFPALYEIDYVRVYQK